MATIGNDINGRKRVLFIASDGTRKTLRLGKATRKQAEEYRAWIEALVNASITGVADEAALRWAAERSDAMHARLAAVGLVKGRNGGRAVLGVFIDAYIESRQDVKPHTLMNMNQVKRWLLEYFSADRDMRTVTAGDAEDWRAFMLKSGLGDNTVRRHIGRARQLFNAAIRRGLLRGVNPFLGMATTVRASKDRMFFVTRDMAEKVLSACPDAQWRLMFALSRFGGLRCPSEHLALKWSDINWEHNRIRVPSPKTEHHAGKECRIIPLFPEIKPYLLEVFEEAEPGAELVITRYQEKYTNLRTQLGRIIRKAGLKVWPKPWHNLRATRQTELCERYPIHVVCDWIGNSRAVAQEHYLQVTDAHFAKAVTGDNGGPLKPSIAAETTAKSAAQNPAQYGTEMACIEGNGGRGESIKTAFLPLNSPQYDTVHLPNYPRQDSNL